MLLHTDLYDALAVTYVYIEKDHFASNIQVQSKIHLFPNILFICLPALLRLEHSQAQICSRH